MSEIELAADEDAALIQGRLAGICFQNVKLKLRKNLTLFNIFNAGLIMKIDAYTTNLKPLYGSPSQDEAGLPLQRVDKSGSKSLSSTDVVRGDVNNTSSSIVSISNEAMAASQTDAPSDSAQQPSLQNPAETALSYQNGPAFNLMELMNEMLSGRIILGMSEADMQSVRASGANSDVQLKRIENAAMRAGFGIERHIPQTKKTVDQTTFQARGVVRTAKD